LQRRKTRTRHPELVAAFAVAFTLTGCGSGSEQRAAPPPKLPPVLAANLAARSDEVAEALAAGDSCTALNSAKQLQRETIAAINSRRVPGAFQEQLASSVTDLVSRIQCVPLEEPDDRGKHRGKHKKEEGDED
jgi:hypothetical protein